jgi:undecaprenyl-diphosphatase
LRELDLQLFRWINGWPEEFAPFFYFWSESNKWLWMRLLLLGIILALLCFRGRPRTAGWVAVLSFLVANELTDSLKFIFKALRPCVELSDVNLRVNLLTSYGTASAHSANMAAVATVFVYCLGNWGWLWAAFAFFTGLSRIYVGVHYPSQVLLGWLCGILTALTIVKLVEWVLNRWQPQASAQPESDAQTE